jgi:hypothetical protein
VSVKRPVMLRVSRRAQPCSKAANLAISRADRWEQHH